MIKDITLGQYYPGQSGVHRVDARVKILLTIVYMVIAIMANGPIGYAALFALVIAAVSISRLPARLMLRTLRPLVFILILTFVLNLFMVRTGEKLFEVWVLRVYSEGLRMALLLVFRLVALILGTSLMTLTTSPISLTDGLERLMKPLQAVRFPAHELAMMMTIALRFIPTLLEEADKIMKAQSARGADFESGNLLKRARAMIPLLVPLFISAFRRADELALAMESRCYHGGANRTSMKEYSLHWRDLWASLAVAACALLVLFERYGVLPGLV